MIRLILEGVAGVGKTSVLSCLKKYPELKNALFVSEEETLGELFSEMQDQSVSQAEHVRRLYSVLSKLESTPSPIVLERFHHSYFALGISWDLLQAIDTKLNQMNFKTALLDISDSELMSRSLKRKERAIEGWQDGFIELYGSADAAVAAFKKSQSLRHHSLGFSHLQSQIFNTEKMDWNQIAQRVLEFAASK